MLRIATFNIENLDSDADETNPALNDRIPTLQALLNRISAQILCLQEVHGQELPDHQSDNPSRDLSALDAVLDGSEYAAYHRAVTKMSDNVPYDKRNLVVLSAFPILDVKQYRNDLIEKLQYKKVTAMPAEEDAGDISWERPILHINVDHPVLGDLHVINLHLKSRLASNIRGQKQGRSWKSAGGWAEGYFLSSIKRVGQAIETRVLLDNIFEADPEARVIVCGDFNAEPWRGAGRGHLWCGRKYR